MKPLTLDEVKILLWFGGDSLQTTRAKLCCLARLAESAELRETVIGLLWKLWQEEYADIYEDMIYDIRADHEARQAASNQYWQVLNDETGSEAEALLHG